MQAANLLLNDTQLARFADRAVALRLGRTVPNALQLQCQVRRVITDCSYSSSMRLRRTTQNADRGIKTGAKSVWTMSNLKSRKASTCSKARAQGALAQSLDLVSSEMHSIYSATAPTPGYIASRTMITSLQRSSCMCARPASRLS